MSRPMRARARGFTLLEVMVSVAILSGLVIVLASSFAPIQRVSTGSSLRLDLDQKGRHILAQLRRELRTSGWQGSTPKFTVAATSITFQRRVGPGDADWSDPITYKVETVGPFKGVPTGTDDELRLVREQSGNAVVLARGLSGLEFTWAGASSRSVAVKVTLLTPDPRWSGGTAPAPIRSIHEDRIELLNVQPQ